MHARQNPTDRERCEFRRRICTVGPTGSFGPLRACRDTEEYQADPVVVHARQPGSTRAPGIFPCPGTAHGTGDKPAPVFRRHMAPDLRPQDTTFESSFRFGEDDGTSFPDAVGHGRKVCVGKLIAQPRFSPNSVLAVHLTSHVPGRSRHRKTIGRREPERAPGYSMPDFLGVPVAAASVLMIVPSDRPAFVRDLAGGEFGHRWGYTELFGERRNRPAAIRLPKPGVGGLPCPQIRLANSA